MPQNPAPVVDELIELGGLRFHYRSHTVDPSDVLFLENLNHVDVDEVNAELLAGDAVAGHLFDDRVGEFRHLLSRSQLTRCCQSTMPKIAPIAFSPRLFSDLVSTRYSSPT